MWTISLRKKSLKLVTIAVVTSVANFGLVLAQGTLDPLPPCETIEVTLYRPFTLMRKIKFATAYFVNPTLPEQAVISPSFTLGDVVKQNKANQLWSAWTTGQVKVLVPWATEKNVFASLSSNTWLSPPKPCQPRQVSGTQGTEQWSIVLSSYLRGLNLHDRQGFLTSVTKLTAADQQCIRFVADKPELFGIEPQTKFVAWEPAEAKIPWVAPTQGEQR